MRQCAFILIGFVAAAVAMGFMVIFISVVVAAVASVLEGVLRKGVDR